MEPHDVAHTVVHHVRDISHHFGELRFVWVGFLLQLGSQLCESSKLCLQNLFLVGDGLKFDAMSFVLLMSPLCALVLAVKMYLFQFDPMLKERFVIWLPLIALNTLLAFFLNIVIAFFIKNCSAVSFVIAGILKDIIIVLCSSIVFREHVSMMQSVGFFLELTGIFVYGLARTFPEEFRDGVFPGIRNVYNYQIFDKHPPKDKIDCEPGKPGYGSINGKSV